MYRLQSGFVIFIVLIVLVQNADSEIPSSSISETIRVAILRNASTVIIAGEGKLASSADGEPISCALPAKITCGAGAVYVGGKGYRQISLVASASLLVNGRPYRGEVDILPDEKGLLVINEPPLEEYLVGVINGEISSAWPIEAVKAQAVIARTYAMNRRETHSKALYHLESTVISQVYDGSRIDDSRAKRAVFETEGEVLTYKGAIIQALYHSSCGGKTEAAGNVWGQSLPYLKGVECNYCLTSPSIAWEQTISLKECEKRFRSAGFRISGLADIEAGVRNSSGRLNNIVLITSHGRMTLSGNQFRKLLGYGVIKSTNFTVKVSSGTAFFTGIGNGHGVGLCQLGAKQRALDGFDYREILSYYYPGTVLKKLY